MKREHLEEYTSESPVCDYVPQEELEGRPCLSVAQVRRALSHATAAPSIHLYHVCRERPPVSPGMDREDMAPAKTKRGTARGTGRTLDLEVLNGVGSVDRRLLHRMAARLLHQSPVAHFLRMWHW